MDAGCPLVGDEEVTSLKPYLSYYQTDLPWLGQVPTHWEAKRLKYVAIINPSKTEISHLPKSLEVSFLPMELVGEGILTLDKTKTLEEVGQGFTYFRDGDVVIAKITPSFENGKGSIVAGLANGIGFGTTELHVIRPSHQLDKKFLYYLTISNDFRAIGAGLMQGTAGQKRVPDSFLLNYPIAYPPSAEQQVIGAYLDHQTAKIDALIAKKQRLLDLLAEQRSALISQAVTKGLNPDVEMKDSGVLWLGQVPSHWDVSKLGYVSISLQTGPFGSQIHSGEYVSGGIPLINPAHIKDGKIFPSEDTAVDQETWNKLARHELLEGDIVFARRGEMGRCALVTKVEVGWLCGTGSIRVRPNKSLILPEYLSWALSTRGISDWLSLESVGTTMDNLNTKILASIPLPLPPTKEQEEIVIFLNYQSKRLANLVIKIQTAIERLQEYRAALISSVVTGKVMVESNV